jgi:hypothetical protein
MRTILIGLLYTIMSRYIGGGLMRRMGHLIEAVANEDIPGEVKRQRVLSAIGDEVKTLGTVAINAALEVALLKLRDEGRA